MFCTHKFHISEILESADLTKFRKVGMDKDTEMLVAGTTIINFNLPLCTIVSFIFSSVYLLYPLVV
jgi:hypothetical protein